jgi:hypothetical protein
MDGRKKGAQPNNTNAVKHGLTARTQTQTAPPTNDPWNAESDLQAQIQALEARYTSFRSIADSAAADGSASIDSLTKAEAALTTLTRARLKAIEQLERLREQRRRREEYEAFYGGLEQ